MSQSNWKYPVDPNENIDGYSFEFRNFINSYINAYEKNRIINWQFKGTAWRKKDIDR